MNKAYLLFLLICIAITLGLYFSLNRVKKTTEQKPVLMIVENWAALAGYNFVSVFGKIQNNSVKIGDKVTVSGFGKSNTAIINAIEKDRQAVLEAHPGKEIITEEDYNLSEAHPGDYVWLKLDGIKKEHIEQGMEIRKIKNSRWF